MPGPHRAFTRVAGRRGSGRPVRTSIDTSGGRTSKRRMPSVSRERARRAATSVAFYERLARRKGHAKAIGAVARHLAEATYWILSTQTSYREPSVGRFAYGG